VFPGGVVFPGGMVPAGGVVLLGGMVFSGFVGPREGVVVSGGVKPLGGVNSCGVDLGGAGGGFTGELTRGFGSWGAVGTAVVNGAAGANTGACTGTGLLGATCLGLLTGALVLTGVRLKRGRTLSAAWGGGGGGGG
jgi:hypothetical protein